jgi:hypothetical protein
MMFCRLLVYFQYDASITRIRLLETFCQIYQDVFNYFNVYRPRPETWAHAQTCLYFYEGCCQPFPIPVYLFRTDQNTDPKLNQTPNTTIFSSFASHTSEYNQLNSSSPCASLSGVSICLLSASRLVTGGLTAKTASKSLSNFLVFSNSPLTLSYIFSLNSILWLNSRRISSICLLLLSLNASCAARFCCRRRSSASPDGGLRAFREVEGV